MTQKKMLKLDIFKRWRMQPFKIPILLLFSLLLFSQMAFGQNNQFPNDPTTWDIYHSITISNFSALPGTVAKMPISLKNQFGIAGFLFRIEYDTTMLTPYRICDNCGAGTVIYDTTEALGRGSVMITIDSARTCENPTLPYDTVYNVYSWNDTGFVDNANRNALFVQFYPPFPPQNQACLQYWDAPVLEPSTFSSQILQVLWLVKPGLSNGAQSTVRFWDYRPSDTTIDPPADYRDNQLTNTDGAAIFPTRVNGTFTVGTPAGFSCDQCPANYTCDEVNEQCIPPTGTNHAPTIGAINPSTFSVTQGEAVPTVTVTATDSDGDVVSLLASNLPSGATFSPSNPVTGTGSATGTFNWTPSLSTAPGSYVVNFRATDANNAQSSITSIVISVDALDIDRLYTNSAYGGKPVGGIPGAGPIALPIDLVTSKTVYGIDFYMAYPGNIAELDSIAVTSRTPEYVVYENIGQFPDTVKVVTFGLANEVMGDPDQIDGTAILKAFMTIDSSAVPGDYWVYLYDAWESIDPDPEVASLALMTDSGVVQVDMMGDVNIDKRINVADLVNVVGYIIGNYDLTTRHFATANVVNDGVVNVVDLVGIINMIFGRPISPSPSPSSDNRATVTLAQGELVEGQYTKLNIAGEFPENVAGIQLEVNYDPASFSMDKPEIPSDISGLTMSYRDDKQGHLKMVMYSSRPWDQTSLYKSGLSSIVNLPAIVKQHVDAGDASKIRINKIYLANADAAEIHVDGDPDPIVPASFVLHQNYPNPFNPSTTIEFDISADGSGLQDVELSVFNILGQKVKTLINEPLMPGHYSAQWDSKSDNSKPVATGVYLYQLKIGDQRETKKMVLLK